MSKLSQYLILSISFMAFNAGATTENSNSNSMTEDDRAAVISKVDDLKEHGSRSDKRSYMEWLQILGYRHRSDSLSVQFIGQQMASLRKLMEVSMSSDECDEFLGYMDELDGDSPTTSFAFCHRILNGLEAQPLDASSQDYVIFARGRLQEFESEYDAEAGGSVQKSGSLSLEGKQSLADQVDKVIAENNAEGKAELKAQCEKLYSSGTLDKSSYLFVRTQLIKLGGKPELLSKADRLELDLEVEALRQEPSVEGIQRLDKVMNELLELDHLDEPSRAIIAGHQSEVAALRQAVSTDTMNFYDLLDYARASMRQAHADLTRIATTDEEKAQVAFWAIEKQAKLEELALGLRQMRDNKRQASQRPLANPKEIEEAAAQVGAQQCEIGVFLTEMRCNEKRFARKGYILCLPDNQSIDRALTVIAQSEDELAKLIKIEAKDKERIATWGTGQRQKLYDLARSLNECTDATHSTKKTDVQTQIDAFVKQLEEANGRIKAYIAERQTLGFALMYAFSDPSYLARKTGYKQL